MATTSVDESSATRSRVLRGLLLFRERAKTGEIEPLGRGRYSVPSCTTAGEAYAVDLDIFSDEPAESCGCPDHRRRREPCKHIVCATIHRAKARAKARRESEASEARRRASASLGLPVDPAVVAANLEKLKLGV